MKGQEYLSLMRILFLLDGTTLIFLPPYYPKDFLLMKIIGISLLVCSYLVPKLISWEWKKQDSKNTPEVK